jgi:hypothetical protein
MVATEIKGLLIETMWAVVLYPSRRNVGYTHTWDSSTRTNAWALVGAQIARGRVHHDDRNNGSDHVRARLDAVRLCIKTEEADFPSLRIDHDRSRIDRYTTIVGCSHKAVGAFAMCEKCSLIDKKIEQAAKRTSGTGFGLAESGRDAR